MSYLSILALLAGASIAIQANMNANLGVLLKNPLFSTMIAFAVSCLIINIAILFSNVSYPSIEMVLSVPVFLWFSGLLSAFGVGVIYYLIPKMGAGALMSFVLTSQIVVAMIASHFGWFDLPLKQINTMKLVGVALLMSGVFFVNWEL